MSKIKVLDSAVYNKIAAGEVVEKPASIVKELVENSIDSGATIINIEIENGGIDRIRVSDNGCGIYPEEVKTAFLAHATSKISNVEDLSNITSLGFRGEALASIASVSKIKLQSKVSEIEFGKRVEIHGGEFKYEEECGLENGTTVEVLDLFYNIPARKKFLRKPKTEESEITNLIVRYILSNPNLKISYTVDNKLIYSSTGEGLEDAIYVVYKREFLDNLIKVDFVKDDVRIYGYISKPTFSKANRTYQTLIINKRYVINSMVSTAVQNAYDNYLMKGQFPVFILNFELPASSLDVNVHPNKLDVKFENTQYIYGLFYSSVSLALNNYNKPKEIVKSYELESKAEGYSFGSSFTSEPKILNLTDEDYNIIEIKNKKQELNKQYESLTKLNSQSPSTSNFKFSDNNMLSKVYENKLKNLENEEKQINEVEIKSNSIQNSFEKPLNVNLSQEKFSFESDFKIIGTCFDTYIFVEKDEKLYILDQHACHERLNYDNLVSLASSKTLVVQPMLIPEIINVNSLEFNFINENLENFESLGFETQPFGDNCFKVSTFPSVLKNISVQNYFNKVLSDLSSLKAIKNIDLIKDKLAQMACKASVRAGDKLSYSDIELLIKKLNENETKLLCPHGRPAVIEITKTELEKWFKRIV